LFSVCVFSGTGGAGKIASIGQFQHNGRGISHFGRVGEFQIEMPYLIVYIKEKIFILWQFADSFECFFKFSCIHVDV
jgi:hypothetical protein